MSAVHSLHEVQSAFARGIFFRSECAELIAGPDAEMRLAIYRNNVFANYREALRAVYPVVERLIGCEFFQHVADRYIETSPSTSGDLHDYGCGFADFIHTFGGLEMLVYLPDVARLEWMIHESFHAADYGGSAVDALNTVTPEEFESLNFVLHPACRLLASQYPVRHIWRANQDGAMEETIDLAEGGENVLVSRPALSRDKGPALSPVERPQYEVELRGLSDGEFVMLAQFVQGESFGTAYLRALGSEPSFDVAAFMQTNLQARTLVDFKSLVISRW